MCRKLLCITSFVLLLGLVAGPAVAQEDVDANDVGPLLTEINIRISDGGEDAEQHLDDNRMDIGSSDLELILRFGASGGDHYDVTLAGGEVVNFSLVAQGQGDPALELVNDAGDPIALGIAAEDNGIEVIRVRTKSQNP